MASKNAFDLFLYFSVTTTKYVIERGIRMLVKACKTATFFVISLIGKPKLPIPRIIGRPAAPKLTAVEFAINAIVTANIGVNPSETKSGAAIAAGVPNPATPSIILENKKAMIIAWILLSSEIVDRKSWSFFIWPFSLRISIKRIAPKIISIISVAMKNPFMKDAEIKIKLISQKKIKIITVTIQVMNIVVKTVFLSKISREKIRIKGINAKTNIFICFRIGKCFNSFLFVNLDGRGDS